MNGSPGLIYMESVAQANGTGTITLTFEPGTNPDLAQVDVQNRLSRATPRLPAAVTQQGVRVDKSRTNFLLFTILSSDNPAFDPMALGDYASRNVLPESSACPASARRSCSAPSAPCASGSTRPSWSASTCRRPTSTPPSARRTRRCPPAPSATCPTSRARRIAATVVVNGQLANVEQFGNIVLRANTDGSTVRLRDVARIELGGQTYATSARLNGKPSAGIGVQLAPSGNALATAKAVRTNAWTSCRATSRRA